MTYKYFDLLGLATYTNGESIVLSYTRIFDMLWIKAELAATSKWRGLLAEGSHNRIKLVGY